MTDNEANAPAIQPAPEGPTDEELDQVLFQAFKAYMESRSPFGGPVDQRRLDRAKARAALACWGRPAIRPIPVAERLPEAGDLVWHCYAGVRSWEHGRYNGRQFFIGDGPESQPASHWRPHHALPIPQPTQPTLTP